MECQSHRLTIEDAPTVEYMARYIAGIQQQYTQRGGVRPFGLCILLAGVSKNSDGQDKPQLFLTEPSGIHSEWRAACIGRQSKTVREFLEKTWCDTLNRDAAIKLAVRALMEVVQSGASNMELVVVSSGSSEVLFLDEFFFI